MRAHLHRVLLLCILLTHVSFGCDPVTQWPSFDVQKFLHSVRTNRYYLPSRRDNLGVRSSHSEGVSVRVHPGVGSCAHHRTSLCCPPPPPGCIGRGGGTPPSRAPSLCPATVPPTASASLNGICNRQ